MSRLPFLFLLATACGTSSPSSPDASADAGDEPVVIGGDRPVSLFMTPDAWDGKTPLPLLMVLHGYSAGGLVETLYLNLEPLVNEKQIILVAPDGLIDSMGERYWNAVDTCCDFDHRGEDDVAYLTGVIAQIAANYPVDPKRIYVFGHSNGASMAMRLACDASSTFAGVFELAGPFWSMPAMQCHPTAPVAVRVLHGTADTEVPYDGGTIGDVDNLFSPGAQEIATFFAANSGCDATADTSAPPIDLDEMLPGAETTVTRYTNCMTDGDVELWSMQGGSHLPDFQENAHEIFWDFFASHSR